VVHFGKARFAVGLASRLAFRLRAQSEARGTGVNQAGPWTFAVAYPFAMERM
jgi:hypothetical protein